jgi:ABC-type bacteriocin/lantibiotic exporter with double-glycine peptidase domain
MNKILQEALETFLIDVFSIVFQFLSIIVSFIIVMIILSIIIVIIYVVINYILAPIFRYKHNREYDQWNKRTDDRMKEIQELNRRMFAAGEDCKK